MEMRPKAQVLWIPPPSHVTTPSLAGDKRGLQSSVCPWEDHTHLSCPLPPPTLTASTSLSAVETVWIPVCQALQMCYSRSSLIPQPSSQTSSTLILPPIPPQLLKLSHCVLWSSLNIHKIPHRNIFSKHFHHLPAPSETTCHLRTLPPLQPSGIESYFLSHGHHFTGPGGGLGDLLASHWHLTPPKILPALHSQLSA